MKLIFYLFVFSQIFNYVIVFADKYTKESPKLESIKWKKIQGNNSNNLKKIIWKSYKDDESYFQKKIKESSVIKKLKNYKYKTYKEETYKEETFLEPLNKRDELISHGGITVSNALIPEAGTSQINLNYDYKGNFFGFYGYSLSNIFQLELINISTFQDINYLENQDKSLYSQFLSENNLNYRLGGKLLLFSPQKEDLFWITLRTSIGRNNDTFQNYLFSELINTFRFNDRVAVNLTPKYFFSGEKSFGGLGVSSNINLLDNLQLIPELNTSFKNNSDFNYSLGLRYSYLSGKSIDIYYSNAVGIQDLGQLLEDKEYRLGFKLNFLY